MEDEYSIMKTPHRNYPFVSSSCHPIDRRLMIIIVATDATILMRWRRTVVKISFAEARRASTSPSRALDTVEY